MMFSLVGAEAPYLKSKLSCSCPIGHNTLYKPPAYRLG